MKYALITTIVGSLFLISTISAQTTSVEKLVEKGNKYYNKKRYEKAKQFYLEALEIDSNNVEANLYTGIDLLQTDYKWKALPYIEKAYAIDPNVNVQIDFYLGLAYQYNYQFKKALYHLERAKTAHHNYTAEEWKEIYFRIEQCKSSIRIKDSNRKYNVENMGPGINSPYRDYAPKISPTQDKIIFASNRREGKKEGHPEGEYFMDIYVVNKDDNGWNSAQRMDKTFKTSYDDMGLSFDSEGKKLLIYKTKNFGDIYMSEFSEGKWGKPENLGNNINTRKYSEISACLSPDGKTIFFTSNRPGGSGGMDIYISHRNEKGNWTPAENLGSNINSAGDEEGPFISSDGKMLFFSSDGHPGIGGLDIFYCKLNEQTGEWGKPQNMGFPVNSPENDINFVLSQDGLFGYYTAIRTDTYGGEDIYKVTMSKPEQEGPSLLASIYNAPPNDLTGEEGHNTEDRYTEKRNSHEYEFQAYTASESIARSEEPDISNYHLIQNVYFDLMEAELHSNEHEYLDRIAAFMEKYSGVRLELAGHTDDTGSEMFNINLSWKRAEAVFKYLTAKGIKPSRMSMKGYGKSKPLATNDDEREGRELNRRVEFKILPDYDDRYITGESSYARVR